MDNIKVKICANRSIDDAKMCIYAGCDIIGILVGQRHFSTDFVDKEKAKEICDFVAGRVSVSLVTHIENADEIISLTKYIGNDTIQLHSQIKESEVEKIVNALPKIKLVRVIHVSKDGIIQSEVDKIAFSDYYLLDSYNIKKDQVGGTGIKLDWEKCNAIISSLNRPTFLAGGLNPKNVSEAIKIAMPYGVDVNSGCKNAMGVKDAQKVKEFVYNAKHTFCE